MPTAASAPKSSIYIDPPEAEVLRELAAELGLVQTVGGGAKYQAGSLSALMRFLAAACGTTHRATLLTFLRTLQQVTTTTVTDGR
jgi:hypothetical protein